MSLRASAPGKVILLGEHAVVYGQPALAAPVSQVQATAEIAPGGPGLWIAAPDIGRRFRLENAPAGDPLAQAARLTLARLERPAPDANLTITSTIPLAAGLGSGAAVCTAVARALALYLGQPLAPAEVSAIVFETEKLLHGAPSGIDNTVIAYNQPVYFIKGQPPEPFPAAARFHLLIADTGRPSPTKLAVAEVRAGWQKEPAKYEALFAASGELTRLARACLARGQTAELGPLLTRNHALLQALHVSSPELDALVAAALTAGALGAKLCGGGRGGNMLALVEGDVESVRQALQAAGARRVIETWVES